MADKVLDVRHVIDDMVSPEGLQAGGGSGGDAYTKEECDAKFASKSSNNTYEGNQTINSSEIGPSERPERPVYGKGLSFTGNDGNFTIAFIEPQQNPNGATQLDIASSGSMHINAREVLDIKGAAVLINGKRIEPPVEQIIKAPLIQPNTSATAYEPGNITFEKLNAKFDDGAGHQWPVFKFFAQCNFAAGANQHQFYFNVPSGYRLPVVNNTHDQLYLEGLNVTVQYSQSASGGRGFACLSNAQYHTWNGCDALVATHGANSDVAADTQIKITLDRGGSAEVLSEPFIVNIEFALALEETE